MMLLITLTAGMSAGLLLYSLLGYGAGRQAWAERLDRTVTAPGAPPPQEGALFQRWSSSLGHSLRGIIPASWLSFLRRRLKAAGLRSTAEQFVGRWVLLLGTWYLVVSTLAATVHLPAWLITALLLLSLLAPLGLLGAQEAERTRRIRKEFPFLIDFVTMAVEAGLSLEAGLLRAGLKIRGPLGDELERYVHSVNRGLTRRDALLAFADGLGLPEAKEFVQVLIQSSTSGLPLAEVLRSQSRQIREFHRLKAEEAAQKIPLKLLFPLVLFIFPTIFLFVLGPALIWLFEYGL